MSLIIKMNKSKIKWRVVISSIIALVFVILTFLVDWIFIIGAVILLWINQKELYNK